MDESSYYYDDDYGLRGYILNTCTFSRKHDIDRLAECLEVNLKLKSQIITPDTIGIYILIVTDVTLFNKIVYPCLLPGYYKKIHNFNVYPKNLKAVYHHNICKKKQTNMTQSDLIIGNILGGSTKFIKTKNTNLYILRFELPETEKTLLYLYYLIMSNIVGVQIKKKSNKKNSIL
jgi:hypothetical protein